MVKKMRTDQMQFEDVAGQTSQGARQAQTGLFVIRTDNLHVADYVVDIGSDLLQQQSASYIMQVSDGNTSGKDHYFHMAVDIGSRETVKEVVDARNVIVGCESQN